MFRLISVFWY